MAMGPALAEEYGLASESKEPDRTVGLDLMVFLVRAVKGLGAGVDRLSRWILSPLILLFDWGYSAIGGWVHEGLDRALRHPAWTIGIAAILLVSMVPLAGGLGESWFRNSSRVSFLSM